MDHQCAILGWLCSYISVVNLLQYADREFSRLKGDLHVLLEGAQCTKKCVISPYPCKTRHCKVKVTLCPLK